MASLSQTSKGRRLPIFDLQSWAVSEIKKLSLATNGSPEKGFPVVFVEQATSESVAGEKDRDSYNVTILFDVTSRSSSQVEAYETAQKVVEQIDFTTANFGVNSFDFFSTEPTTEMDDLDLLQRLPIRLEMNIIY